MAGKSYVTIRLDTTPPDITLIAPSYVVSGVKQEIIITSTEDIYAPEIYLIDVEGNRYNYIFKNEGKRLVGLVNFYNMAEGIATLYAKVYDRVLNPSILATKAISIKPTFNLIIKNEEYTRGLFTEEMTRKINPTDKIRGIEIRAERIG